MSFKAWFTVRNIFLLILILFVIFINIYLHKASKEIEKLESNVRATGEDIAEFEKIINEANQKLESKGAKNTNE